VLKTQPFHDLRER